MTNRGQGVTLTCEPISGHDYLHWYRQTSVDGIKFLISFGSTILLDETGLPNERFSAQMPNGSFSTLKIQPTEPQDSVVYLCASSSATALHSQSPPPCSETSCFPFCDQSPSVLCKTVLCSPHTKRHVWVWDMTRPERTRYKPRNHSIENNIGNGFGDSS